MKPFWRTFWAANLSNLLVGVIFLILFAVLIGSIIGNALAPFTAELDNKKPFSIKENAILHLKLSQPISETSYAQLNTATFDLERAMGIKEIKSALEYAKTDEKVKGILLSIETIDAGMASIEEIRQALLDFQTSGKFIYSYSEFYDQKAYYLASVADSIYLFPGGVVEFRGLGSERMFFKGTLDKLGVEMQIIRGSNNKFKSAVEPFMLDSMSPANKEQTMTYLSDLWMQMVKGISAKRDITYGMLNEIADSLLVRSAKTAVHFELVDALVYEDQLHEKLRTRLGIAKDDELNLVNFEKYLIKRNKKQKVQEELKDKNIAVIYAVGEIESGNGDESTIGSATTAEHIRKARLDDNIKAIILRINSPGGSALASDVIWREVVLARQKKKVVVSMGDVAASGGYYIACAADKIYAQPNTITGSIGVFGMVPNFGPAMKKHLGITVDYVQTNDHASFSLNRALRPDEIKIIQQSVDEIYEDFISKVAEGRGMSKAKVDSIGQGRVWSGEDGKQLGLVDEIGGIDAAIQYAASEVGIPLNDIVLDTYPKPKDQLLLKIIEAAQLNDPEDQSAAETSELYKAYKQIKNYSRQEMIQARIPYYFQIK